MTARLYRPSNGTEGDIFIAQWCDRCARGTADDPCEILGATLFFDVDDPQYPPAWIEDADGPRCTAFEAPSEGSGTIHDARQADMLTAAVERAARGEDA